MNNVRKQIVFYNRVILTGKSIRTQTSSPFLTAVVGVLDHVTPQTTTATAGLHAHVPCLPDRKALGNAASQKP